MKESMWHDALKHMTKAQWRTWEEADLAVKACDDLLAQPTGQETGAYRDTLLEVREAIVSKIEELFDKISVAEVTQ